MTELWSIGLVLAGCVVGAFTPLFFKFASEDAGFNIFSFMINKYVYLAVFYAFVASILFVIALRGGELSVLYPIVATGYIWVSLLSIQFLKEKMNCLRWMGVLTIILGVILLGLGA